ncbi:unnamed protein product, partial [Chrysoparadoxa australica]
RDRYAPSTGPTHFGRTPLMMAASGGHAASAAALLEAGAAIDGRDAAGWTAMHWAARWSRVGVLQVLLLCKASIDTRGSRNITPLLL